MMTLLRRTARAFSTVAEAKVELVTLKSSRKNLIISSCPRTQCQLKRQSPGNNFSLISKNSVL